MLYLMFHVPSFLTLGKVSLLMGLSLRQVIKVMTPYTCLQDFTTAPLQASYRCHTYTHLALYWLNSNTHGKMPSYM